MHRDVAQIAHPEGKRVDLVASDFHLPEWPMPASRHRHHAAGSVQAVCTAFPVKLSIVGWHERA